MMTRAILIGSMLMTVVFAGQGYAVDFLTPSDPILAIDVDTPVTDPVSNSPGGENPPKAIDGVLNSISIGNKYLNFGKAGTGFIVTPSGGAAPIQSFKLFTANDAVGRDPASYEIWGTNSPIVSAENSNGLGGETWTFVSSGALALPDARFQYSPLVSFANATAYTSYKVIFPTLKNNPGVNSMQFSEIDAYSTLDGSGGEIFAAGSPIRGMGVAFQSDTPANEGVANLINGDGAKYLNFGEEGSGFIVSPANGAYALNRFQITTANDATERDPASYALYGTNSPIRSRNHSHGDNEAWTQIATGTLDLPMERNTAAADVTVTNTTAYSSYKMVFPTLRDAATANSLQIGEIVFRAADDAVLTINRQSGNGTINATNTTTIKSYQITSANGGFTSAGWTPIAVTGADPDDTWIVTSPPGSHDTLAEQDGPSGANNGITINPGSPLNLGTIWRILPTTFEDVDFIASKVNGSPAPIGVQFTGTEIPFGDYSGNGAVGPEDWPIFRAGYGATYQNISRADAYLGGDLDGDFDSDLEDFNLFVEAAGGAAALFGGNVPEPGSLAMLCVLFIGACGFRRSRRAMQVAAVTAGVAVLLSTSAANAQSFINVGNVPGGITIPAGQQNETAESGPEHLFDDTFLDDTPTSVDDELFILDYNAPDLNCPNCLQYAGLGPEPKVVFLDYGAPVTADWFAYSQRSGADPTADRVGTFEFWFSNTDFGGVPMTPAHAVVHLLPTDARLRDSVLRPYTLGGDHTGQYVAMRLTVSALSAGQPTNNIGGHEFRLLDGPGDVILEVNRGTGALTLKNNLADAQAIELKSYKIESPAGALDVSGFNGVRGDSGAFPAGNGSGNGWEIGGGSNSKRLVEGYFSGVSTLAAGTTGLPLGNAYNEFSLAQDLQFIWTNDAGEVYDGRVTYIGTPPTLAGDYNGDGRVNAADYVVWRKNPGAHGGNPGGYNTWRANFGAGVGAGSGLGGGGAVPEAATCVYLAVATVLGFCARRRA